MKEYYWQGNPILRLGPILFLFSFGLSSTNRHSFIPRSLMCGCGQCRRWRSLQIEEFLDFDGYKIKLNLNRISNYQKWKREMRIHTYIYIYMYDIYTRDATNSFRYIPCVTITRGLHQPRILLFIIARINEKSLRYGGK